MASSKHRLVRHEGIRRGHAANRRVEIFEELIGDTRGDLRAIAPAQHVFVSHDHAVGFRTEAAIASQS